MNFKNVMTKVKKFVTNFKNPIIAVGCILIVAAIVFTVSMIAVNKGDAEPSTCDESLVTEEDSSVEEIESTTVYNETTQEETTTAKTVVVTTASTTAITTTTETSNNQSEDWLNGYSYYEYDLLARTIYQESGICGEYCQWLVGSTVLNLADRRGGIENVVFDYNTFNVAHILFDATPSDLSYAVARRLISGDRDYKVMAFRDSYYHNFGTPYTSVDNMYFSVY